MENTYDEQIAHLKQFPENILFEWKNGKGVFKMVGQTEEASGPSNAGCLTMIRMSYEDSKAIQFVAYIDSIENRELTKKIGEDIRIPSSFKNITIDHLELFKEYQLLADKMVEDAQNTTTF